MSYKTASLTYCLAKSQRNVVRSLYRWHVFRSFDANDVETNDSLGYIEKGQLVIYQFGQNCLLTDKGYYVIISDKDIAFDNLKVTVYDEHANDVGIVYLTIADLTGLLATRDFAEKNLCVLTSPSNTYLDNQIIREIDVTADDGIAVYFYSNLFNVTGNDSRSNNPNNITPQEVPDWLHYIHFQGQVGLYELLQKWCDRVIQTVSGARIELRIQTNLPVYIYEVSVMTMDGEYIATWELDENQSGIFYFDAYKDCIIVLNKYCPYCLYSEYTFHSNKNSIDWVYKTIDGGVTATYSRTYCGITDRQDDELIHTEVANYIDRYKKYFKDTYPGISFPCDEFPPMLVDKNTLYSITFNSNLYDSRTSRPSLENIILVDRYTHDVFKVLTLEDAVNYSNGIYYWNEVMTRPTVIISSVTNTPGQTFEVPITIQYSLGINILDILRVSGDILDMGNNTLVAKIVSGGIIEIQYNSKFPSYIDATWGISSKRMPSGNNTLISSKIYHTRHGGMYDSYTIFITSDSPTCVYSECGSVNIPSNTSFKGGDNPKVFKTIAFSKEDKTYVYTSNNNKDINRNYTSIPMIFANNAIVRDISIYSDVSASEIFSIETGCFLNCLALKSLNFNIARKPKVQFGSKAIFNCQSLSDFIVPLNTLSLGDLCMAYNLSLLTIDFSKCTLLQSIGDYCFYADINLKRVILPEQLDYIGKYCFSLNTNLTSITCNVVASNTDSLLFIVDSLNFNNLDMIPEGMFSSCIALKNVNLPSTIANIESNAFKNCNSIKHFTSPGLFIVENKAFANTWIDGTTSSDMELVLEYATYGESNLYKKIGTTGILFDIPGTSFGGLNKNYTLCTYISPTLDNSNLILYKCNEKQIGGTGDGRYTYALNHKTISVSPYAFSGNYDFGNIGCYSDTNTGISQDNLRYIGDFAFKSNNRLKAFRFPLNGIVNYLGEGAFYGCSRLSELYNFRLQPITKIKDYTFYNCGNDKYGLGVLTDTGYTNSDFYIPDTTKEIGNYAFAKCPQLMTIANLPSCDIIKIGDHAFEDSFQNSTWKTKLGEEIALFTTMMVLSLAGGICYSGFILGGQLVINAVNNLIAGCIGASVGTAGTITSIATTGKNYRKQTAELFFPKVTSIGTAAFKNCSHLGAIHLSELLLVIPDYCFENCKRLHTFLFDSLYDSKTGVCTDRMPNITAIGKRAFYNCKNLKIASMNRLLCKVEVLAFLAFANAEITASGNEDLIIFPKTLHILGEQSLLISNGFTCIFISKTPPKNVHQNVFGTTNKSKITILVPQGSKSSYLQKFTTLQSNNFIEVSDSDPFWESLNDVYKV